MLFTQEIKLEVSLEVKDQKVLREALNVKGLSQEDFEEMLDERFSNMMDSLLEDLAETYSGVGEGTESKVKAEYL